MRFLKILLLSALLSACATPVSHTNIPLSTYDKDTEYGLEDRPDGFEIVVHYSRYATAYKSALTSIAWEVAEKKGRKIDPINEQRIRISMGRNGFSGITSCQAFAVAKWKL